MTPPLLAPLPLHRFSTRPLTAPLPLTQFSARSAPFSAPIPLCSQCSGRKYQLTSTEELTDYRPIRYEISEMLGWSGL